MVDIRQSSAALHSQQRDFADPGHVSDGGGNSSGTDNRIGPVVVGVSKPDPVSILVTDPDPWLLTENDIEWMQRLGAKKYHVQYDPKTTEAWFRNTVLKSPLMFYATRLRSSFCVSMLACVPWLPNDFECHVVLACADDGAMWEVMKLLRDSIRWARFRKCKIWRLSSDTENDFAAIARRLGVTEISPRFSMEL